MTRLQQLSALGQSVWIDFLSRDLIESGALARAVEEDAVVGVTSNPSIFGKALRTGTPTTPRSKAATSDAESVFLSLACATSLRPATCCGRSGSGPEPATATSRSRSTRTSRPTRTATIAQATHFHETIARPNLLVKIPATDAGVPAIEEMTARGYSINVTLIFSLEPPPASGRGLPARTRASHRRRRRPEPGSFGRQLLRVTRRHRDRPSARRGRTRRPPGPPGDRQRQARLPAIQGAVLWRALAGAGGTRGDHAALPMGVDLDEGPELPRHPLCRRADRPGDNHDNARGDDRGLSRSRPCRKPARERTRGAQYLFKELYAVGVDYDDIVATLEREGIEKFDAAFNELLEGIAEKRQQLASAA